jgi:hypothetical protein
MEITPAKIMSICIDVFTERSSSTYSEMSYVQPLSHFYIKYANDPMGGNCCEIVEYLEDKEIDLRKHEEFEEVNEDDLAALEVFCKKLRLGPSHSLAPIDRDPCHSHLSWFDK